MTGEPAPLAERQRTADRSDLKMLRSDQDALEAVAEVDDEIRAMFEECPHDA